MIASLRRLVRNLLCVGNSDNFGIIATSEAIDEAVDSFTSLNDPLRVRLKRRKSGAGSRVEFLGKKVCFADASPNSSVGLPISAEGVRKLTVVLADMTRTGPASVASMQKLAGYLRFAQTAVMARFGQVALKPLFRFIAGKGRKLASRVSAACGRGRTSSTN